MYTGNLSPNDDDSFHFLTHKLQSKMWAGGGGKILYVSNAPVTICGGSSLRLTVTDVADTCLSYLTLLTLRTGKGKLSHYRPWGSRRLRLPGFLDNWHLKVVGLSALSTGRLYPPGNIPGTHFC
jgi:hypothetical protein